jgi:CRISPR-associated protein Cmr6
MIDPLQRPNRPNPSQPNQSSAVQRPQPRSNSSHGGGNRGGGGNNRGDRDRSNNSNSMPSPWLFGEEPPIDDAASFVEYLRWMREPDYQYKDGTKTQILQLAQDKAKNYHSRLSILNERTKLMAEVSFEVKSSWRLRVGGHRGTESILLPTFDALGMPYLPSSSLRGVARTYAIRELMKQKRMD